MKLHLTTFAIIFLCSATLALGDSTADLTQLLKGLFSLTEHADIEVSGLMKCLSTSNLDAIQNVSVDLIAEGADCNPTKIFDFKTKIEAVYNQIPQNQIDCVMNHSVIDTLGKDYNIIPMTQTQIATKVIEYGLAHMLTLCEANVVINSDIQAGDWKKVGVDGGKVLKNIFGVKSKFELFTLGDSLGDLNTLLTGLASATSAAQADVSTIAACASANTAEHLQSSLVELITEAAACNPLKVTDITTKVDALLNSFPASELDCLKDNTAAAQVIDAFGITGLRKDDIKNKIVSYIMAHLISACSDMHTLSADLAKNDWNVFGAHAGKMLLKVFTAKSALRGVTY